MRFRTASRFWPALCVMLLALSACDQYRPQSTAIEETLGAVTFDPPEQPDAGPAIVRADGREGDGRKAETYFGAQSASDGAARASRSAGGVQLNFDGAEIREVAQVILRDILGKNYTIDPQITGQVVLSSSAPLGETELLTILETVLQMHGATLVASGESYAIQSIGQSQGGSQFAVLGGREPPLATPGLGFTVVPLRYMTADAAAQFVQPLVSRPEQIRVDSNRNLLLFSGTNAERQTVLDTLVDVDIDWMSGRSVGIFPLAMSTPEAIIPELTALFGPIDPNGLNTETIRFLPMARLNAVLVIANEAAQLARAKTWVTRLDRGNSSGMQFFVYQLQHVPATDMAKLLSESLSGSPTAPQQAASEEPAFADSQFDNFADAATDLGDGFEGTTAIAGTVSDSLLSSVKIVPNELNNTLLIRAPPKAYEMIEATLRRLDTAPLQVLIEATIAEVTLNDQLRYGVQYFLNAGNFRAGFNTSTITNSGVVDSSQLNPLARLPGFNFVFSPGSSNITLDALARVTDVKVLSSPSLLVQDNREAVLNVGDEVPIVTRSATNVENSDSVVVNNIEYRDTGVILEVKPRISSNSMVALQVSQEVSRVATETTVQSDSLTPTIQQRKINSTINVLSGQTIVLGGLIQDSETGAQDKVPLLGDVPVLGNLFQNNNTLASRTELIVFITPRIIRNAEDARDVSEELRDRMRSVAPLPQRDPKATSELPQPDTSQLEPAQAPQVTGSPPPVSQSKYEADIANGSVNLAPASRPLRPEVALEVAGENTRSLVPLPASEPLVPSANPKRPVRVALPMPQNLARGSSGLPVPSARPRPIFELKPKSRMLPNNG